MCNRFILVPRDELQRIILDVMANIEREKAANVSAVHKEAFGKSLVPLVVARQNRLEIETMSWGFPKDWGDKKPILNTRGDTATDKGRPKNMWREPLARRRCVVPTYGFYEPHRTEKAVSQKTGKPIKQQYIFNLPGSPVIMLAGIFGELPGPDGAAGYFSIMTTEPNRWMKDVHDRMPVVLLPHEVEQWLADDENTYLPLLDRQGVELARRAV